MKRAGVSALLLASAVVAGSMLAAAPAADAATGPGVITTVAGGPGQGPPLHVSQAAVAVGVSSDGSVDVGDGAGVVRQFSPAASYESVVAGVGVYAPGTGDGGPATRAHLGDIGGLAYDHAGNMIIADLTHCRIQVVAAKTGTFYGQAMQAGDMYTVAGTGVKGYNGDGIPARTAQMFSPRGVAVDKAGNIVVADYYNNRIRVIAASTGTFYGQAMTAGDIYTIAGTGARGSSGNKGPATAAELWDPAGVAVDRAGDVLIATNKNNRIRLIAASTGTHYGQHMTAGDIYSIAGLAGTGNSGNGGPATAAHLYRPYAVTLDHHGNVVIADTGNSEVRVVAESTGTFYGQQMTAGDIYQIATASYPFGVAVDAAGNVLIPSGLVYVVAATTGSFYGQHMTAGSTYTVAGQHASVPVSGNGRSALDAQLGDPRNVAAGPAGGVLISSSSSIRMTASVSGTYYGVPVTAGDIYAVAGNGKAGYSGDGGPATSAEIDDPAGLLLDAAQNMIIADWFNNRIRVVAAGSGTFYGQAMTAGDIYTIAGDGTAGYAGDGGPATQAELNRPDSAALDENGNVIIDDSVNHRVRVVAESSGSFYGQAMTAGNIYTIAGDGTDGYSGDGAPASAAEISGGPVAVGSGGTVLIDDVDNQRIRAVATATGTFYRQAMTAGNIYTIAGNGTAGYSGDGGPATSAEMYYPSGISVDSSGNALIADWGNSRIRVVAAGTGSFYGRAMTAGSIYTVAGDGRVGFAGDGGKATSAVLDLPQAVAATSGGGFLIADTGAGRIRAVSG